MTPAEIDDKWWRYIRVRDDRELAFAIAMRTSFGAEVKDWKRFALNRRPRTQEIDPPEKPVAVVKDKVVRRKGRKLTMEELAAQED